jgi:ParB-like chromosome segregation protein Spo0J
MEVPVSDNRLELRYIPLAQARRWDENPKRHDLDALARSIETHGFGDPPKFDSTLGALVYGNGRTEALERMRQAGKEPPRGIGVADDGDWAVPVIFGVDSASRAAAVAFAIDHNNLTLLGGGLSVEDLLQVWDEEGLQRVLGEIPDAGALLASLGQDDIDALLRGPDFQPAAAGDQSRLDQKAPIICPECGAEIPR